MYKLLTNFFLIITASCTHPPEAKQENPESYTNEEIEMLDNSQDVKLNPDEVMLPNGMTTKEFSEYLCKTKQIKSECKKRD